MHPVRTLISYYLRSALLLTCHLRLGLSSSIFPSGLPNTIFPAHTPLDLIMIIFGASHHYAFLCVVLLPSLFGSKYPP